MALTFDLLTFYLELANKTKNTEMLNKVHVFFFCLKLPWSKEIISEVIIYQKYLTPIEYIIATMRKGFNSIFDKPEK